MAAFPSYDLARTAAFSHDKRVETITGFDGTSSQFSVGDHWVSIRCRFNALTASERSTLKTFLNTNRYNVITWTIDGIDYSGYFVGGQTETRSQRLYNIEFTYLAEEV